MNKVVIKRNPNGDTRTASPSTTYEEFQEANRMHIKDVGKVMVSLAGDLMAAG